jgi:molybdopterin converting factor small subunit
MNTNSRTPQRDLIPRSMTAQIPLGCDHPLVQAADSLDWEEIRRIAQEIRCAKLKNAAGRPPRLRATLGALLFMALRKRPYRETEDVIRYYAPARYFCGLKETTWTPDFTTIQDFTALMGQEGIKRLNQYVVGLAVEKRLADPTTVVADTTAQEAAIPHPGEIGLMAGFLKSVRAASVTMGHALKGFVQATAAQFRTATQKAGAYRLFAKSKAARRQVVKQMADIVERINEQLGKELHAAAQRKVTLRKKSLVSKRKLDQLHQTMSVLLPQIRFSPAQTELHCLSDLATDDAVQLGYMNTDDFLTGHRARTKPRRSGTGAGFLPRGVPPTPPLEIAF